MSSQDYQAQASSYSYTSYTSSSSSSTSNGETNVTGNRHAQQSYAAGDGTTTTQSLSQNYGEPVVQEIRRFGADGKELPGSGENAEGRRSLEGTAGTGNNRVEDVTESEEDRSYRERMEEEYAKREGGA